MFIKNYKYAPHVSDALCVRLQEQQPLVFVMSSVGINPVWMSRSVSTVLFHGQNVTLCYPVLTGYIVTAVSEELRTSLFRVITTPHRRTQISRYEKMFDVWELSDERKLMTCERNEPDDIRSTHFIICRLV